MQAAWSQYRSFRGLPVASLPPSLPLSLSPSLPLFRALPLSVAVAASASSRSLEERTAGGGGNGKSCAVVTARA
eukprot:3941328-Rhodomonas_salina.1